MKHVALVGATGLTGSFLLNILLKSNLVTKVSVLARSESPFIHEKLEWHTVDLLDPLAWNTLVLQPVDLAFCCIGTTKAQTPDKDTYKSIDFGIPVSFAHFVNQLNCKDFAVISSIGADPQSNIFYTKTKGQMEEELKKINFKRLFVFRPSLIEGKRKSKRLGEKIGSFTMRLLDFCIPNKYKPISGSLLASVMWDMVNEQSGDGLHLIDSKQIFNKKIQIISSSND